MFKKKKDLKKKISKIAKEPKEKTPLFDFSQEVKNSIWIVLMFTIGLVLLLGLIGQGGMLGNNIAKIADKLMGLGNFLLPSSFFLAGFAILRNFGKRPFRVVILGIALFVISILSLLSIIADNGGLVGFWLTVPLKKLAGFPVSIVVFLSLLFISLLIAFDISLKRDKKEIKPDDNESKENKNNEESLEQEQSPGFLNRIQETISRVKNGKREQEPSILLATEDLKDKNDDRNQTIIMPISGDYKLPPLDILQSGSSKPGVGDTMVNSNVIKKTLQNFGIDVEMADINIGPTVTQYTLKPATGIKLSKIVALQSDLALSLAAHPIRIEAPIPGRSLVGIEIPNQKSALVRIRELIEKDVDKNRYLKFGLGKDVSGDSVYSNLASMPHLLIAGATGSGKSVCIHSIITSLLYKNTPETARFIFIDPKRVELTLYNGIPHLLSPVIIETQKILRTLKWVVGEMERRYEMLAEVGAKDITSFNLKQAKYRRDDLLPYLVIVIDELADIMMNNGREVEVVIVRLAQMARAVGIHLIVSTQRPSIDVITGLIKANITSRIAFQVASQIDSRTILDMGGAEKLLGNGDMLFMSGDMSKPKRIQGAFVSEKEITKLAKFWQRYNLGSEQNVTESNFQPMASNMSAVNFNLSRANSYSLENSLTHDSMDDDLYDEAVEVVLQSGKASASLLQRRLKVGYARAARLIDILEEQGIVGSANGAKPREILIDKNHQSLS